MSNPSVVLGVVIPTYNHAKLLELALERALQAKKPVGLKVTCIIVDNNSTDSTKEVAREYVTRYPGTIYYIHEQEQEQEVTLRSAIKDSKAEWIGIVSDYEQINSHWFRRVHRQISEGKTGFLGGPYLKIQKVS